MLQWWLRALIHASVVLVLSISSMAPSAAMGADLVSGVRAAFACRTPAGCIPTAPGGPIGTAVTGIVPPGDELGLSTTSDVLAAAPAGPAAPAPPGGAPQQVQGPTAASAAGTVNPGQPSTNIAQGEQSGAGSTTGTGSTGTGGGSGTSGTSDPDGSTDAGADTTEPSSDSPTGDQADPTPPPSFEPGESAGSPSASSAPESAGPIVTVAGDGMTTAAQSFGWGRATKLENFDSDLAAWEVLTGTGNAGKGRRTAAAVTVRNGLLTIAGDANGTTGGLSWSSGSRYGRWEARMRAPLGDPTYHALLLLRPEAEGSAADGGIDVAEMADPVRRVTDANLFGPGDARSTGSVRIDATQWHHWAVDWTPRGITTYVDGQEWWSVSDASILPREPLHLALQLDWFPDGGTVSPSEMSVDWVAFYPAGSTAAEVGTTSTPATTAAPALAATTSRSATTSSAPATTTQAPRSQSTTAPADESVVSTTSPESDG